MENAAEKAAKKTKKRIILFFNTAKFFGDYLSMLLCADLIKS